MEIPVTNLENISQLSREMSTRFGFKFVDASSKDKFVLEMKNGILTLIVQENLNLGEISVDFLSKTSLYRKDFGGGRGEAIAKAVGFKKGVPTIIDATAGLGRDAFVLASCGARVHMIERNPFVVLLLADGLKRAESDPEIGEWVKERMSLSFGGAASKDMILPYKPDVIYLDPMYPHKKKSALVKKEMRIFQELIGQGEDGDSLFEWAINNATKKVIVKRPLHAENISSQEPNDVLKSKKNRFDIYLI